MKIKVLFYIDTLSGGGAEKVLRNLVNSMDTEKFDITVQTTFKENHKKYLNNGINYKYCYKARNKITDIIFRLETQAGLIYPLHNKSDYDIEVAYLEAAPTKIIAGSTNKKAKKLAWVHCDLQKNTDDVEAYKNKTRDWYNKYDRIVCVSKNVEKSFKEIYGDEPETVVVYNTIDDSEIKTKSQSALSVDIRKRKLTLITVGRFLPQKNYPRLLKTVKTLLNEGFDFDLWVLGDGALLPDIEEYIKKHNISQNIRLFGFVDNPYPFIRNADIAVCSSDYEGFSTFITESLILGKPIVTTDCSGMDELLGENEYGIITENHDDAFTDGLRKMLKNPDLINNYAEKSAIRGQEFSKEFLTQKTEKLFLEMLNK